MYTVEEFDKEKTKVLRYILYKKRTENEVRTKFQNTVEENLLDDIIDYLKEAGYINDRDYIERTINNFISLKNLNYYVYNNLQYLCESSLVYHLK